MGLVPIDNVFGNILQNLVDAAQEGDLKLVLQLALVLQKLYRNKKLDPPTSET